MKNDKHYVQCPNCGRHFTIPISTIERQILKAINIGQQRWGSATTKHIAQHVYLSQDQALRYLLKMEQKGIIYRIGTRSGWRVEDEH